MNYTKGEWKVDFTKVTGHCGISIDSPNRQVANVYLTISISGHNITIMISLIMKDLQP